MYYTLYTYLYMHICTRKSRNTYIGTYIHTHVCMYMKIKWNILFEKIYHHLTKKGVFKLLHKCMKRICII